MEIKQRAAILRGYEAKCYSVCYYILQCESKAIEAAKRALLNIIKNDLFFLNNDQLRNEVLRNTAIKAAIDIYASQLSD
jgi:hypothetical protein